MARPGEDRPHTFRDLPHFLSFLEERQQLRRLATPVSASLEITEIADRVVKAGGPALLFENVEGCSVPLAINLFGTEQRMAWALGEESLDAVGQRVEKLLTLAQANLPASMFDKLKVLGDLAELASYVPKNVGHAPCQEVVNADNPSLARFPILKCWPQDGGPYLTLPLVITKDPATGKRNVGMYRLQVYDERTTGMHWHLHKGGAQHYRAAEARGQRLEVAVALGCDPATIYAATAPLPPGFDEFTFAGFLRRKALDLVRCRTVGLEVPANSEIVLEGYVEPGERRLEGPFGDHTGYYSLPDWYPVFHITCITQRQAPIYPATVVGRPPMEDYYLGKATERLFLPMIKMVIPDIVDIHMPAEGVFHNLLLVSIRKEYPAQAQKVMHAIWGFMGLMLTKAIVVVDSDVNVHDVSEVAWRVCNNVDPRRDLVFADGPLDALDHASPYPFRGSKVGIDATRKSKAEGHPREWPADIAMDPAIRQLVDRKWKEYGI